MVVKNVTETEGMTANSSNIDRLPAEMTRAPSESLRLDIYSSSVAAVGSPRPLSEDVFLEEWMMYCHSLNKELDTERKGKSDVENLRETNKVLRLLISQLVEQNKVLISSLLEVEREAEQRTIQMQKRLRTSAQTTKDVVLSMSDWGQEIRELIIRKCQAENMVHEMEANASVLRVENQFLKDYNASLCHDIQSLLNIIKEARRSGHWEMDFVAFCEITPEDIYGPIHSMSTKDIQDSVTQDDVGSNDDPKIAEDTVTEETYVVKDSPSLADLGSGLEQSCYTWSPSHHKDIHHSEHSLPSSIAIASNGCSQSSESKLSSHVHVGSLSNALPDVRYGRASSTPENLKCSGLTAEEHSVSCLTPHMPPGHRHSPRLRRLRRAKCKVTSFSTTTIAKKLKVPQWCGTLIECKALGQRPQMTDFATQTEETSLVVQGSQTDVEWEGTIPSGNKERDQELGSLKERLNIALEEGLSKTLLASQLQAHLDASASQVDFRDQAIQNLERKLFASREECNGLKKNLAATRGELEAAQKAIEKEREQNARSATEVQQLFLTVQHLQQALVMSKKITDNSRSNTKEDSTVQISAPRVQDI